MTPNYNGPDRRTNSEFEKVVYEHMKEQNMFMATIKEHMANQLSRCDRETKSIYELDERTTSLEASREYSHGVLKTIGVGIPAIGSVGWFLIRFIDTIKHRGG